MIGETVKRLDNCDEGVLSTLYICFKINETIVDSDFLTYYFESTKWHKGLSDIAGEGARNHGLLNVSMTDYFNTKHRFPSMEEQKVIAKMLNAITEREREAIMLGECYRKQKAIPALPNVYINIRRSRYCFENLYKSSRLFSVSVLLSIWLNMEYILFLIFQSGQFDTCSFKIYLTKVESRTSLCIRIDKFEKGVEDT